MLLALLTLMWSDCHPMQECQANADRTFLLALAVPLAAAAAAVAYLLRPPPQELKESGQVFEDEATGFLFHTPEEGTGEHSWLQTAV
jgi:hypothetical protein